MRFRTRAFLLCFVPFAILLSGSFLAIRKLVLLTVKDGLRTSLRDNHASIARVRAQSDIRNSRFLRIAGENASLKACLQLLLSDTGDSAAGSGIETENAAKQTVEDQLRELGQQMGFDFLMVSDSAGTPLAGVTRKDGQLIPLEGPLTPEPRQGLMMQGDYVYRVASVPIDQEDENLGELSVGERFDFSDFNTPVALVRNGQVLGATTPGIPLREVETALKGCGTQAECDVRLGGEEYISLSIESLSFGDLGKLGEGYTLRSLENVESASRPLQAILNRVFLIAAIAMVIAALMCSVVSSRSMEKPITAMISRLRRSEATGVLPEFRTELSSIREIRDLTSGFNLAAGAAREARRNLQSAYVEFVETLASALDARDQYTAGHSSRVSELSRATAMALGVTGSQLEEIRIGALLHDIGKIGIADEVLQKPGKLTAEEFWIIKQHPGIGRRILEGVHGFAPYLAVVELHHENWDGSGYPWGQVGEQTPLAARIVHVADAYDAMTSDRPYRRGMSHDQAFSILREFAGRQFDPAIVGVFTSLEFGHQSIRLEAEKQEFAAVGKI